MSMRARAWSQICWMPLDMLEKHTVNRADKNSTRVTFTEILLEAHASLTFKKMDLEEEINGTWKHLTFIATSANCMAKMPVPEWPLADLQDYLDLRWDADSFIHEHTGAKVLSKAVECLRAVSGAEAEDGIKVKPIVHDDGGSHPEIMLDNNTAQELRRLAAGLVDQLQDLQSAQQRFKSNLSFYFTFPETDEDTKGGCEASTSPQQ